MLRTARFKRAPNRGPTSLAAPAITTLGKTEAINSTEALLSSEPNTNIDPALIDYDIQPQSPSNLLDFYDTFTTPIDPDTPIDLDPEYPLAPLVEDHGRAISWSPTPIPGTPTIRLLSVSPTILPSLHDNIYTQLPVRWTLEMEEILFNTLLEQVDIGKRADSGFKKEAWIACCSTIKRATGLVVSIEKCKGKVDTMKALWRELNWLKEQSGFGWNSNTGLIQAGDQAWKDVIKVSNIRTYYSRSIANKPIGKTKATVALYK